MTTGGVRASINMRPLRTRQPPRSRDKAKTGSHAPLEAPEARAAVPPQRVLRRLDDAALAEQVHPRAAVEQADRVGHGRLVHAAARAARARVPERRERLARAEERRARPTCARPVRGHEEGEEEKTHGVEKQMSCAPSVQRVVRSDRYVRHGSAAHAAGSSSLLPVSARPLHSSKRARGRGDVVAHGDDALPARERVEEHGQPRDAQRAREPEP
jgi:hypothetical protein